MLDETYATATATALRRIEANDPRLRVLGVGLCPVAYAPTATSELAVFASHDSADYARLGDGIGRNTMLERVEIDGDRWRNAALPRIFYEGIERNTSIWLLTLEGCDLRRGTPGHELLHSFGNRRGLVTVHLCDGCNGFDDGGARALAAALAGSRWDIRDVTFECCDVRDESLAELVAALKGSALETIELKNVHIGRNGCNALSTLLRQLDSSLITLIVGSRNIDDEGADAIVRSLRNNNRIETFGLTNCGETTMRQNSLLELVCNTASVNATYLSNHTLVRAFVGHYSLRTNDCNRWLECNKKADKSIVAMEKILGCHPQLDMAPFFEWDMKCLPLAVSWFDTATQKLGAVRGHDLGARKLSAIYQFVRAMPTKCVPTVNDANGPVDREATNLSRTNLLSELQENIRTMNLYLQQQLQHHGGGAGDMGGVNQGIGGGTEQKRPLSLSSSGRGEIDAAKRSLATAKKWAASSVDTLTTAEGRLKDVQKEVNEAKKRADSAREQVEDAEAYLKSVEEKWEVVCVDKDSDDDLSPATKRRKPSRSQTDFMDEQGIVAQRPRTKRDPNEQQSIDAVRMSVGKKVYTSGCELSLQHGSLLFTYIDGTGERREHPIYLDDEELKEVKFYVGRDISMTDGISFGYTIADKNKFVRDSDAYDDVDSPAMRYIAVEMRDADVPLLELMRKHPALEAWC